MYVVLPAAVNAVMGMNENGWHTGTGNGGVLGTNGACELDLLVAYLTDRYPFCKTPL